ncbi:MAG: FxLYD domain-containing protein [Adlercreutzia sp.]|nr:FxLYD domain-containing protein [Adlercreutzia sp.]
MRYCRKCGAETARDARFCEECGAALTPPTTSAEESGTGADAIVDFGPEATNASAGHKHPHRPLIVAIVLIAIVALVGIGTYLESRCDKAGCTETAEAGGYCAVHTCLYPGCEFPRSSSSDRGYCYSHDREAEKTEREEELSIYRDLSVSSVTLSSNSSYTIAQGKITNKGNKTYRFVKVKGAFKDRSGNTVDTDWTYACGDEGLGPGESASFRLSVPRSYSIDDCSVTVLDSQ